MLPLQPKQVFKIHQTGQTTGDRVKTDETFVNIEEVDDAIVDFE